MNSLMSVSEEERNVVHVMRQGGIKTWSWRNMVVVIAVGSFLFMGVGYYWAMKAHRNAKGLFCEEALTEYRGEVLSTTMSWIVKDYCEDIQKEE